MVRLSLVVCFLVYLSVCLSVCHCNKALPDGDEVISCHELFSHTSVSFDTWFAYVTIFFVALRARV